MIKTFGDFLEFYKSDLLSTGIYKNRFNFFYHLIEPRYKLYFLLRINEFFFNNSFFKSFFYGLIRKYLYFTYIRYSNKLLMQIPLNVFNKGIAIVHIGNIIITPKARIGMNCRIHAGTNIGNSPSHGKDGSPRLGDNVYIGPGVKIFGEIEISDGIAIGANAVVNKSFSESNITIAGVPAKKISDNGSKEYIFKEKIR
jgi:serine O-acetyltransferase